MILLLFACAAEKTVDPCATGAALSTCLAPTQPESWYVEQSLLYFDTLETDFAGEGPLYAPGVARWEWPPWLKLTGYGAEDMERIDAVVRLIETAVPERECLFFDEQPFGRCRVDFSYAEHPDQSCPIYEEFTFNDAGEVTFIEAWSEGVWDAGGTPRLSTRVPGLGTAAGRFDPAGAEMVAAGAADADVEDLRVRALDFYATWLAEYEAAGPDVFADGCGW